MKLRQLLAPLAAASIALTTLSANAANKIVGGATMYPSKSIVQNAVNSRDHTTLVAAVKAAGLAGTLSGPGPFTVFAPTNAAFKKLPPGTVDNLLKPESKDQLTSVLTYHVVPGAITTAALAKAVKKGGGEATFKTVQGEELAVLKKGKNLFVADNKGDVAKLTISDVKQSNGIIHVINAVMLP